LGVKKWEMIFVPGYAIGTVLQVLVAYVLPTTSFEGYLNQIAGLNIWFLAVGILSLIAWIMEFEEKS
jgi:hypothetical protein